MNGENTLDGCDDSLSPEIQQGKIDEVRRLIGPQPGNLALYCSDACISRNLRARNWNVKKAAKMLRETLKWRSEYKPEELRWENVSMEAETGKIYRSSYKDKYGRPVLVMRPRCQNTKSTRGQIKYLVYCMENAIMNVSPPEEQMVWLIDFHGFNLSNVSIKVTRETAHILQDHYPERLGVAILYDPPKIFEPFWKMAKPFLEPKTANKVKFVYSKAPDTSKIMDELFDLEVVESAFGGKDGVDFDINKYAERMKEDDKRAASFWITNRTPPPPPTPAADLDTMNSDSDSNSADVKADKSIIPSDEDNDDYTLDKHSGRVIG